MIKLFEEYKNDTITMFLDKVFKFFQEISISREHKVKKSNLNEISLYSNQKEYISMFPCDDNEGNIITCCYENDGSIQYPFLLEYIMENSSFPYTCQNLYFDIAVSDINYQAINNINYNAEDYKIFKDSERFGL